MSREKTNSITHLVKIIAQEVFDSSVKTPAPNVYHTVIDASEFLDNLKNELSSAWDIWNEEEKEILRREYEVAIKVIAANHKRSDAAIRAYITKLEL